MARRGTAERSGAADVALRSDVRELPPAAGDVQLDSTEDWMVKLALEVVRSQKGDAKIHAFAHVVRHYPSIDPRNRRLCGVIAAICVVVGFALWVVGICCLVRERTCYTAGTMAFSLGSVTWATGLIMMQRRTGSSDIVRIADAFGVKMERERIAAISDD